MPTQRNDGRGSIGHSNQETPNEEWRMGSEARRDERDRWGSRDRDWNRDVWDRDRDEYSARGGYGYGRDIDSGRFVQGESRDVRGPQHVGSERSERVGYGSQGYGYGSQGYGYGSQGYGYGRGMGSSSSGYGYGGPAGYGRSTGYVGGMYGRGYTGATEPSWYRGEHDRGQLRMWSEGMAGHRGKGPRNFMYSDDRIIERVCEVLSDDDRIDASEIDVNVKNGEVMLNGSVDDRRAKRLAEDIIEDLPGVSDVQNRLRVRRGLFGKSGTEAAIDHLNSFLRGELAAVETYRIALDKLDKGSQARSELESCKRSHEERVQMLRNEITRLGGTPASSSGPWGVFAKTIEGGARVLGDRAAIAALEEGEDHGLKDYKDDIDKLEPEFRSLVRSRLLPAQEDTHSRMSTLKHRLS